MAYPMEMETSSVLLYLSFWSCIILIWQAYKPAYTSSIFQLQLLLLHHPFTVYGLSDRASSFRQVSQRAHHYSIPQARDMNEQQLHHPSSPSKCISQALMDIKPSLCNVFLAVVMHVLPIPSVVRPHRQPRIQVRL